MDEGYDFGVPCLPYEPQRPPNRDPVYDLAAKPEGATVCGRARAEYALLSRHTQSVTLDWAKAILGLLVIVAGVTIEVSNFSLGLSQLFPTLSNGESVEAVTGPVRLGLGAALIMGHILLKQACDRCGPWLNRLLQMFGVLAVLLLMVGGMIFLAASIGLSGAEDTSSTGVSGDAASPAMGVILACLLPISLLACHAMSGVLLHSVRRILAAREHQQRIASSQGKIEKFDLLMKAIDAEDQIIGKMVEPGAMKQRAATEAAAKIGAFTSQVSAIVMEKEIHDDAGDNVVIVSDLPDCLKLMKTERLKQLGSYLSGFTPFAIYNILNPVEI